MQLPQQNFTVDLILRSPIYLTDNQRKHSADYRPRSNLDRKKQKDSSILSRKPNQTYTPLLNKSKQIIEGSFKNKQDYSQFTDKCYTYLNKKISTTSQHQETHRRQQINSMFKNIKEVLKQNEKQDRKQKEEKDNSKNQGFLILRSQLQHQLYKSQDKTQFFKMTKMYESPQQMKKTLKNKSNRYILNPFDNQTVACSPAQLHQPPPSKDLTQLIQNSLIHRQPSATARRIVSVGKPGLSRGMSFNMNGDLDCIYPKKIKSFFQFIFKVNYSNGLYIDANLNRNEDKRYKVYIGRGNNSILVKSLLRRRFWWQITSSINDSNIDFYWSQNTIDRIHQNQIKVDHITSYKRSQSVKRLKNQQEIYELNKKILSQEQILTVQKYIYHQGLGIPFELPYQPDIITNHIPNNHCIGSKKNLFKSLYHYHTTITKNHPFKYMPKTYHIRSQDDPQFVRFQLQNQEEPNKIWIVKPGQNTNRGKAIRFGGYSSIAGMVNKSRHENGQQFTFIIQSYINRPLLYNNRKFDIRHFMLITSINGCLKGYWYRDGYIRTSSYAFDLLSNDVYVHLTNDAIQKKSELYQKYQPANKLSYSEIQRYLEFNYKYNFDKNMLPKMKSIAYDIVMANYQQLDHQRLKNNFQIIGLDFMIDKDFKPWLIQANYNPCLQVDCIVLERVIPPLIQNTLRLALDPLYPPTSHYPPNQRYYLIDNHLKNLKYELIFDQGTLKEPVVNDYQMEQNRFEEQEYADEGSQVQDLQL